MEHKPTNAQIFKYSLKLSFCLVGFTFLLLSDISAQDVVYSITGKKAIKLFEEAKTDYQQYKLHEAEEKLLEAIEREPAFVEAYSLLGYVYLDARKPDSAEVYLEKAFAINPNSFPNNYFILAELELQEGDYEEALSHYLQFEKTQPQNPDLLERMHKGIKNAQFAIHAMQNPVDFDPQNLGSNVNSDLPEYFPSLTVDGKKLLFTRRLEDDSPVGFNEDFYLSEKENGEWQEAVNIGIPINSPNNEGAPTISADGQLLIFTACEIYGDYGENRQGFGSCDLFYSYKNGNQWGQPRNLGKTINTAHWETQPSFSADGRTLYFIRGIRGREGKRLGDIYFTRLDSRGMWSLPERLGDQINTEGNEESVFIHPDGKTLYFASDGHVGMGGLDIFISRKDSSGEWGEPVNLGYPINTHKNENSLLISADGKLAYFASDRNQGQGHLDLYSFELPEQFQPEAVSYFAGKIFDKETKEPLSARFELINLETGTTVVESFSNEGNGSFLVTLPPSNNYALNVSKDGYLFFSENFSMKSSTREVPQRKDIPLQPIKLGEKIVLRNIFFETAKYNLKKESRVELFKLIEFLKRNPNVKIEVSGHTDNVGNDADNLLLSRKRAEAVVDFLLENGIEASRLKAEGYGETKEVASNSTEEGRALNRRTEFEVTGL